MHLEQVLFLGGGLLLLTLGAEFLVRGASRLAGIAGISPLVIGLTVVAYGTSSPEMAVSVESAYSGQADIALGNVVGSNIFNVLFILGVCAVIVPLRVVQQLVWLDVPLMIGASCLVIIMGVDGKLSRVDGILLFSGAILYTVFAIKQGRKETATVQKDYADEYGTLGKPSSWPLQLLLIVAGLAMLVLGARWLVDGAVEIAKLLSVSELVIGLTIIAAGTSLPELATSIIASIRGERHRRRQRDRQLHLQILAVRPSSAVSPEGQRRPAALTSIFQSAIAVPLARRSFTGHLIARWEGALFALLQRLHCLSHLNARAHDSLPASAIMLEFILPLTLLTLAIAYARYAGNPNDVATASEGQS
jgi:cation:H+ antiporter